MTRTVHVSAPSRIHFGMFSFGDPAVRQFGGVGMMVGPPRLELEATSADAFSAIGETADRARDVAAQWAASEGRRQPPACRIQIASSPPAHAGLGSGTQLALSVAAALDAFVERRRRSGVELAQAVGRAERSAVGTHGFSTGGLLVDPGKAGEERVAPVERRIDFPAPWRILLITDVRQRGLSGSAERSAFAELPPVPRGVTAELREEVDQRVLPACATADFPTFSAGIYRYGHLAGTCFAACQGGAYASPHLARLVELIRSLGVDGVGQSSWGPTLFAVLQGEEEAKALAAELQRRDELKGHTFTVTAGDNVGAVVEVVESEGVTEE